MKEQKNENLNWIKLDNASKIFPATYTSRDTKVFRISVELNDYVDKDTLQASINEAVEFFPIFNYVLRRGVFWYYFEYSIVPKGKEYIKFEIKTLTKKAQ